MANIKKSTPAPASEWSAKKYIHNDTITSPLVCANPVQLVLQRLQALRHSSEPHGSSWACQCPAHEDHTPSLSGHRRPTLSGGTAAVWVAFEYQSGGAR